MSRTGGPSRCAETLGPIQIPMVHRHLPIGETESDAWLLCMTHALDEQPYPDALKRYLLRELFVPAERIRQVVADRKSRRCA